MTGLSTALTRPKMTATISSVSTFAAVSCPVSTIPGTIHAATPSAAADTRIRRRIFMAIFLQHRGVVPGNRAQMRLRGQPLGRGGRVAENRASVRSYRSLSGVFSLCHGSLALDLVRNVNGSRLAGGAVDGA